MARCGRNAKTRPAGVTGAPAGSADVHSGLRGGLHSGVGLNTTVIYLQGLTPAEAVATVTEAEPLGRTVHADEAMSSLPDDLLYAAATGDWVQLWIPSIDIAGTYDPGDLTAMRVLLGSVSGVYALTYSAYGEVIRDFIYMDGELFREEGDPLPIETTLAMPKGGPDEDHMWAIVGAVTGTRLDFDLPYETYRVLPS